MKSNSKTQATKETVADEHPASGRAWNLSLSLEHPSPDVRPFIGFEQYHFYELFEAMRGKASERRLVAVHCQ
jgi:hypothetical protein